MDARVLLVLLIVAVAAVVSEKMTICEGNEGKIKCKEGTIKIKSVMYGRQDRKTCKDSNANNINCSSGRAQKKVENKCNGQSKCKLVAQSDQLGGDPCVGTSKYLEVHWNCKA